MKREERLEFLALNVVDLRGQSPYLCLWCRHAQMEKVEDNPCRWTPYCSSVLMLLKNLMPGALRPVEQFVLSGDDCSYFLPAVTREEAVDTIGSALIMVNEAKE